MPEVNIDSWLLMGSGFQPIIVIASFLALLWVSKLIGSWDWQETWGKPFLKWYYLVLALINLYLAVDCIRLSRRLNYSLACEPTSKPASGGSESSSWVSGSWSWLSLGSPVTSESQVEMLEAQVVANIWIYLMSKIVELVEQIVFALLVNKTEMPIVLHHITMFGVTWLGLKWYPGGSTLVWIIISTVYLAIGYSFNCLKRFKIISKPWHIWFKPGIIFLKNLHFALVACHCLTVIFSSGSTCAYPKHAAGVLLTFVLGYVFFSMDCGGSGGGGKRKRKKAARARDVSPQRSDHKVQQPTSGEKDDKDVDNSIDNDVVDSEHNDSDGSTSDNEHDDDSDSDK